MRAVVGVTTHLTIDIIGIRSNECDRREGFMHLIINYGSELTKAMHTFRIERKKIAFVLEQYNRFGSDLLGQLTVPMFSD